MRLRELAGYEFLLRSDFWTVHAFWLLVNRAD
jgi:hypothetical protein